MKFELTEEEYNQLFDDFNSEEEIEKLIEDLNIEIYVFDDITLAVKQKDRIQNQWLFTQLDTLIQINHLKWNSQIKENIQYIVANPFQPICKTKTTKKTHIEIPIEIMHSKPALIFQKHKFMKKFLRRASREFNIPFGYALRNPVDEPDPTHGTKTAVNRLRRSYRIAQIEAGYLNR